jgi:hypothetical protein
MRWNDSNHRKSELTSGIGLVKPLRTAFFVKSSLWILKKSSVDWALAFP